MMEMPCYLDRTRSCTDTNQMKFKWVFFIACMYYLNKDTISISIVIKLRFSYVIFALGISFSIETLLQGKDIHVT